MTTIIRLAGRDDLDAVVGIEQAAFGSAAWTRRSVEEELAGQGDTRMVVVAEHARATNEREDGDTAPSTVAGSPTVPRGVAGYAAGSYVGDIADVQRIAVLPACRRTGVGTRLLREVVAEARRRGCDRVLLEVGADNPAALALYVADGFEIIDRRPRYYPGTRDALVMQRRLHERRMGDE
ncbi:MAG: GNAT family N-acetyltransferase [Propionibacteriales bacterium]|nr:GNAT family N-acetyltransferase [Propionibacteriales bacterium]